VLVVGSVVAFLLGSKPPNRYTLAPRAVTECSCLAPIVMSGKLLHVPFESLGGASAPASGATAVKRLNGCIAADADRQVERRPS